LTTEYVFGETKAIIEVTKAIETKMFQIGQDVEAYRSITSRFGYETERDE
jgi:hypothetical protein